jgi:hypothetical protein
MSITPQHHYDLYGYTGGETPLPRRAGIIGYLGNARVEQKPKEITSQ